MMPDDESLVMQSPRAATSAHEVNELLRGAINDASGAGVFDKLALCHNTRRMLWEGQTEDGLLPMLSQLPASRKDKVFTWPGAPDTGIPYADEVITEHALIRKSVWNRGEIKMGPRETEDADGTGDEEKAAAWQTAMEFWLDLHHAEFTFQLGLFNTCVEEYGYAMIYAGTRRVVRTAKRTVTLDQVQALIVQQALERVRASMETPDAELPPDMVELIQQQSQLDLELMLSDAGDTRLQEVLQVFDPDMPRTEARLTARDLRASARKGKPAPATYYAPQDDGYVPFLKTLVPFINGIHGTDLSGDGKCWWFAEPQRLCEADVRAHAMAEGWDEKFLDAVLSKPDMFLIADQDWEGRVPSWALSGAGVGQALSSSSDEKFYEVVYAWRQLVDPAGRPMVYHTLVHHAVNDLVGFHECSGLAGLPMHAESREEVLYAVQSRGIPEIVVKAGQGLLKSLMDAEGARAQLASNPPLNRSIDQHVMIEPGRQMFQKRGAENAFLKVPPADQGSIAMMDRVRDQMDRRFFRHPETDPDMKRLYREGLALSAVSTIREVLRLVWKVMQGRVDGVKVGRIAGRFVNLELSRDDMQGEVDVHVSFNVDGLNADASEKTMDWATKLLQVDPGNIDRNELVNIIARMSSPDMARRIILPQDQVAQKIADDQNNRIGQMWAGVPMAYPKRQTAPEMRLEALTKWQQDPENMERLQSSARFMQQMQDEATYLQRQIQQYRKNAVTGQTLMPAQEVGAEPQAA